MDKTKTIGVLMGGLAAERPVSLETGKAVASALRDRGFSVVEIDVARDLPQRLLDEAVDVAWLALHGRFGEDGCVQGLLEVMGIPYTGSGVAASALAMDKGMSKRFLAGCADITLAPSIELRRGEEIPPEVELPAVTKPVVGGSTLGMSKCSSRLELLAGVSAALELDERVLVESYVEGEEITVAIIDGEVLPVVRIVPHSGFFDFKAKYTKGYTHYEVPAKVSEAAAAMARVGALAAYKAINARGLCRVDFIVRADDVPVFLEINTLPGMTATSLSPMAADSVGVGFGELCERILMGAHMMKPEV